MDDATVQSSLATALDHQRNHRFAESEAICRKILAARPEHPAALRQLGMSAYLQGKIFDAYLLIRRATEVGADDWRNWKCFAELQILEKQYRQAAPTWKKVVELQPGDAESRAWWGMTLYEMEKLTEAEEQYRAALKIDPKLTLAVTMLGSLHMDRGEMDKAEEAFRESLRIEPGDAQALGRLAILLGGKLPAADLEALEKRLATPMTVEDLTIVLIGLAGVMDARGEYARAAEYARDGNARFYAEHQKRESSAPPENHVALVDWIIKSFDRDFFASLAGSGNPTRRPIFVFGMPRSGTTLTEQILASHSAVFGAGELSLARDVFAKAPEVAGCQPDDPKWVRHLDAKGVGILSDRLLAGLHAIDGGKNARIVDKAVFNYLRVGILAAMFPNAALVHCRRDVRDVAVSCWFTYLHNVAWTFDKSALALHVTQYCRLMEHWRRVLPGRMYEVQYESMVEDLEGSARKLIAACGLEWEDRCLDFHRTKRSVKTASVAQVRQPIYKKSVARWKHYEKELADLFEQLPPEEP